MLENSHLVKHAAISAASSGNNDLLAASTGHVIRVFAIALFGSGTAVSVYLNDSAGSPVALLGDSSNKILLDKTGASGPAGFVLPFNEGGWFDCTVSTKLQLNLSAAQAVVGTVTYMYIKAGESIV